MIKSQHQILKIRSGWLRSWPKDEPSLSRPIDQLLAAPGALAIVSRLGGAVSASVNEFKSQAAATLNDSRGWSRAGARFVQVPSGGDFVLVLSEANELARRYAPGCSAEYSCRVGQFVIINQDRWMGATPSWNAAGGGLRDYRHMVINHEIGHWLGHGHPSCPASGKPAPVMLQQSIDLQGCKFNPWPLQSELRIAR